MAEPLLRATSLPFASGCGLPVYATVRDYPVSEDYHKDQGDGADSGCCFFRSRTSHPGNHAVFISIVLADFAFTTLDQYNGVRPGDSIWASPASTVAASGV